MLRVDVKRLGEIAVLCLRGQIVRAESKPLREAVSFQTDVAVVVLDLAGITAIDAGGLGLLLELRDQTQSKGIEFRIKNVTKLVKRVLEITRLNSVFETLSEAPMPLLNFGGQSSALREVVACG
jgi:anti-anti-sigma factor